MGLARALIRAPAFVTRSATDTSSRVAANRRGPRRAPGGPPEGPRRAAEGRFFQHMV